MSDTRRLNIEIDAALDDKLSKYIPYGLKSTLVRTMLEVLMDDVEKYGRKVIGDVLDKKYHFTGTGQNLSVEQRNGDD